MSSEIAELIADKYWKRLNAEGDESSSWRDCVSAAEEGILEGKRLQRAETQTQRNLSETVRSGGPEGGMVLNAHEKELLFQVFSIVSLSDWLKDVPVALEKVRPLFHRVGIEL